jgi:phosphate starvation-inducible PhoH-like protein
LGKQFQFTHQFISKQNYKHLCGIHDRFINLYENLLIIKIIPRGYAFHIQLSDKEKRGDVEQFFYQLENFVENLDREEELQEFDVRSIFRQINNNQSVNTTMNSFENTNNKDGFQKENASGKKDSYLLNDPNNKIFTTIRGKSIYPKSQTQKQFIDYCKEKNIVLVIGPAGTGKTYLSVVMACASLENGIVDRILLSRPAVEAGENLGFLPGDLKVKVDPYLRPLYDCLYECYGYDKIQKMISNGQLEIAPLAFMRGRNISNSFILLDEGQNCTFPQLKMILTRLGKNSKMVICGDITQVDLKKERSGLRDVMKKLECLNDIGQIFYTKEDIIRHPLVEKIVAILGNE